ncbi:hypothetical protein GCM10009559_09800 [Pseudonocardia zijingensis]|uniref:Uncharacterized protein n=1 Tax=Pseudonocardia zijingensis TaxID=153376 RepID=A0ABN1PAZ5_9PSEU
MSNSTCAAYDFVHRASFEQATLVMAYPSPASACTNTQPPPEPAPPEPASRADARAHEPDGCDWCTDACTDQLWRQLEPADAVHDAPARAYPALAPTWLEPAHRPLSAAVQSDRATAVPCPPGNAARASPAVCVRQPVPSQLAVASASASPAEPPVATVQPPAAAQVALAVART